VRCQKGVVGVQRKQSLSSPNRDYSVQLVQDGPIQNEPTQDAPRSQKDCPPFLGLPPTRTTPP
jgi:hypothetical protein